MEILDTGWPTVDPRVSLQGTAVGTPNWHRQVLWGQASRPVGDLAADSVKVCVGSDGGGGKVGLRYRAAMRRIGGGD